MKIIVGDELGFLKLVNTKTKAIQDSFGVMDVNHKILNVIKSPKTTSMADLHLIVTESKAQYVLDWSTKDVKALYEMDKAETNNYFTSSILKTYNDNNLLLSCDTKAIITSHNINSDYTFSNKQTFSVNPNPNQLFSSNAIKIMNSSYNNPDNIYVLYQNNPFVMYNATTQKIEFKAKNVPNDELNLRVPMFDTWAEESKINPRNVYISTGYGDIRVYDKKASPKPVMNVNVNKNKINKIVLAKDENCLIMCDSKGYCSMLDIRKKFVPVKNFRGNSGSVQDIEDVKELNTVVVGGYDRYVRWYDYKSGNDEKCFMKNQISSLCVVDIEQKEKDEGNDEDEGDEDEDEIDDDELEEENESEEVKDKKNEEKNKSSNEDNEDDENEEEEEEEIEEEIYKSKKKRKIN